VIIVQDRIEVAAKDRAALEQRILAEYVPGAARRGLFFVEASVSPPFDLVDQPIALWLRYQVADIEAWWAMRSAANDPAVAAFWASVAPLVVARERRYLVAEPVGRHASASGLRAPEASFPAPIATAPFAVATRGWRETAQLTLRPERAAEAPASQGALRAGLDDACRALPDLRASWLAANHVAEYGAGHFTWDLLFPDRDAAARARASAAWRERIAPALARDCASWSAMGLETVGAGLQRPELEKGVKRTALFRKLPQAAPADLDRWERDLLEMPAHIPAILNWRLSRAIPLDWSSPGAPVWSHVWEQEYERLEGLTVDYMVHPHHWAHVDRWFDPESGHQIIDTALCHAFSPLSGTILGRDAR